MTRIEHVVEIVECHDVCQRCNAEALPHLWGKGRDIEELPEADYTDQKTADHDHQQSPAEWREGNREPDHQHVLRPQKI